VSIGNEPAVTRRAPSAARPGARRGVPPWVRDGYVVATGTPPAVVRAPLSREPGLRDLEVEGWTSLHAVPRPGRLRAGIDHVVVGPGGVVVLDVQPAPAGPHRAGRRDASPPVDVAHAAGPAAAVAALLAPRHRTAVRTVVCLAGGRVVDDGRTRGAAPVTDVPGGTVVVGPDALAAYLRALPPRLSPADVSGLAQYLDLWIGTGPPDLLTTAALDEPRVARRRTTGPCTSDLSAQSSPPPAASCGVDRRTWLALAGRAGVVGAVAWLAWVVTTSPLGAA